MRSNVCRLWCGSVLVLGGLAGCSGGAGGSSEVDALSAPEQISLLEADETGLGSGARSSGDSVAPGAGEIPADSDYYTDVTHVHVFDPSMAPLAMINMILCYVSKTAYGEMLNEGDYKAQTDKRLCENGEDGGSGGDDSGASSSSQAAEFLMFIVNSARPSRNSHHVVKFWVPEEEETIHAKMTISEGASESDPFGSFHLDFVGVAGGGSESDTDMYGALATVDLEGSSGFQMFQYEGDLDQPHTEPGDFSHLVAVTLSADHEAETGVARIHQAVRLNTFLGDSGILESEWLVAYDPTHFKRQKDGGAEQTFSRTEFHNHAWRYNLYHAEGEQIGERVELDSGFCFRTEDDHYGWIGYYGLWVPDGATVQDGDTITEIEFGSDEETTYTVLRSPGKLIHHARSTMELSELEGNVFHWWEQDVSTNFLLDYVAGSFNRIAYFDQVEGDWVAIDPPEAVDVAAEGGFLHMWSERLGGSVSYVDGDSFVTYFSSEFVNGSSELFDGSVGDGVTLYGYLQCLDSDITGAEAETGDVYLPDSNDVGAPYSFRFDRTDLTLYWDVDGDGTTLEQVGLADGEAPTFGPNTWGMMSGPLVTDTAGLVNVWEIWGVEEFYSYETGHNSWNGYAAAIDSMGDFVVFDAPLQFLYEHSLDSDLNDDATYAGESYFLGHGGPGDLWGIPHAGVDYDQDGQDDRWYPLFSIAGGTLVGPNGTEYLVRPIEVEQSLVEDAAGGAGLDLSEAEALDLPQESLYQVPGIGDMPQVGGPPAVINGVVVGG